MPIWEVRSFNIAEVLSLTGKVHDSGVGSFCSRASPVRDEYLLPLLKKDSEYSTRNILKA